MGKKRLLLAAFAILIATSLLHANVVALKRSPGLTDGRGLASSITNAVSGGTIAVYTGQSAIADAMIYVSTDWAQSNMYVNYGTVDTAQPWSLLLVKPDLTLAPGLLGGKVNKAELRFYTNGGNSGIGKVGYITSCDWSEGNKAGNTYPGAAPAAPGVSGAHPKGLNTGPFQDAGGVTQPGYCGSWANNTYYATSKDGVTTVNGAEYNPWGVTTGQWDQYVTADVTSIVDLWVHGTPNYGIFIDNTGNYNFLLSENTTNPDWQPILFVDYAPHGTPTTITDLAAGNADWFKLDLTWTAPSATPTARVASYEIRMSASPITDETSFASATKLTGAPTPANPGTTEHFTATGLVPNTTYYFAIKAIDVVGTASALSGTSVSGTTPAKDITPPAQITTLAAAAVKPNYVVLTWTAAGDDGMTGNALGYEMRYSTTQITDANFAGAALVGGLASPKAPGSPETVTVFHLTPNTVYYFAIKACDEVPNWSPLSNVLTFATPDPDLAAPNAVTDLKATVGITMVSLNWTVPSDVGPCGLASYDVRYSSNPINEGNWASAIQVTGEPAPTNPGTKQTCSVSGLQANTTYYFAIKIADYAEPANVSAISNICTANTLPPISPVTVHNPWIVSDRVADTHSVSTMAATYVNAYTPDGVVAPTTNEQKAINIYNNQKRRLYHWADEPPSLGGNDINDPTYNQNVFGWGLCGRHASQVCTIACMAGLGAHSIAVPGDWQYEVYYDGGWHLFHTMTTFYIYTRGSSPHVAGADEIKADNSLVLNAVAENRTCPGFCLCGDTPEWEADSINHYTSGTTFTPPLTGRWTGNVDLRIGQTLNRTWEAWQNEHPTPYHDSDGGNVPGPDAPYHHECQNDWKDYVNFPYWEPYGKVIPYIHTTKTTYRRWSNGTDTLTPDFRSAGYQAMLEPSSHDIATYYDDALTPDLHTRTVGTLAEAIFKVNVPYFITDASFSGDFVLTNSGDTCKVLVSTDGLGWTTVWSASSTGTTHVTNQNLRGSVFATWQTYWVKIQLQSTVAKTDAGVSGFSLTTIFEHNKGALPYLDKGVNHITVTFDNPGELQASGNNLHVTYHWKEYDGGNWTIDKQFDTHIISSPATFTITTGGTKVPRTEYISMAVEGPQILDPNPPGSITDLSASTAGATKLDLTWHAVANDGYDSGTGAASAYDMRYGTSPITDDALFAGATQITGLPAPKTCGSTESFEVTGLQANTTYYFAIKVRDLNNSSDLSNAPVWARTAAAPLPPQYVGDLKAQSSATSKAVDLSWTAPATYGTDGSGPFRAASYDLRYSTSPIRYDDGGTTWNAATKVGGLAGPQAVGTKEAFTITGLTGGTVYYFAIKSSNESGVYSEISNPASAKASVIGVKTLQVGVDAYTGEVDSYIVGGSTNNYYNTERFMVTGYSDFGLSAIQRGILKFDLSGIPAETITNATLSLYSYDSTQNRGSAGFYGAYPLTTDWTHTVVNWTLAKSGGNWLTPGGDFLPTPDGTSPKQATASVWYPFDVTARVQSWLAGTSTNCGWIIKCTDEGLHNQDRFYQCDTINATFRPKLVLSDLATQKVGDINGDNYINVGDLQALVSAWGSSSTDQDRRFDPSADINGDGHVNVGDLQVLIAHWGE